MRKQTTVKPIMWKKGTFRGLSPDSKLVYLLLLTGPETNLAGLVTYHIDEISAFTGLTPAATRKAMTSLESDGTIMWDEAECLIWIVNWLKHNPLHNAKAETGLMNCISQYQEHKFFELAVSAASGVFPDRVSIGYRGTIDSPLKPISYNLNPKTQNKEQVKTLEMAKEVLEHLVSVTGRGFKITKNIEACIKREKCSVEDCINVIDSKWKEWKGTDMEKHVNATTLWRATHFMDYLDSATATKVTPYEKPRPVDNWGNPIPEWKLKMKKQMAEDWEREQKEAENA